MSLLPGSHGESGHGCATLTSPRELTVLRYRIGVVAGPDCGADAVSEVAELSIGTAPGNHLVLSDRSVARHHCVVTATADGFLLRDLGSPGGTFLAGYRIQGAFVDTGALIQIGETQLRFEITNETVAELLSDEERFDTALGQSVAMRRIFAQVERDASETSMLLEGESGTGKGHLARAIHRRSLRSSAPFIVIDCGAIATDQMESELFGHEQGAFGDATPLHVGALESAREGTLVLDEVGALSSELQTKLLRAIESRQIRRVGSVVPIPIDVRIIATTSRDLRPDVNRGLFRADLFQHLNLVRLEVPPLRERREDIPLLATHFFRQLTRQADETPPAELIAQLMRQSFPGNVRELRGAVARAVQGDAEGPVPAATAEPDELDFSVSFRDAKERAVARWTAVYVRELLARFDGNLSRAARNVAMDRNHLRDLLHKYVDDGSGPRDN